MLVNVSSDFPYAVFVDKMNPELCFFAKREVTLYRQLMENSNFPERCPIQPGTYYIRNYQLDLSKYTMLHRGFTTTASFTVHKGDRVLTKVNVKCVAK